jgi:acetyl esterase/lipase
VSADRDGLTPLARALAAGGIVAVTMTYRAAGAGGRFPEQVQDVACAVDFAVQRARGAGVTPGPVVVLGHSAGGHLAALAALGADRFAGTCAYPRAHIDALIGLAGAYDVSRIPDLAQPLFGVTPEKDPARWREGNPLTWVEQEAQRAGLTVLLAHGGSDSDVPESFTADFGEALRRHGYAVRVETVPGATHQTIYSAPVIAPFVTTWVRALVRP